MFDVEQVGYLLLAYLIGSIPTGYLVAKKLKGIDIRDYGSGNTGATNVKRVVGNQAGLFVLVVDFFKGFIPVFFSISLFPDHGFLTVLVALSAMIGHSRSVFLGFSGGKAAITGLGSLLGMEPVGGLFVGLIAWGVFNFTRMVSMGTLTACFCSPLILYLLDAPLAHLIFASAGSLYVTYLHRSNIRRLLQGTENKV